MTSVVSDHHGTSVAKLHNTTRLLTKVRSDPFGGVRAGGMVLVGGRGLLGAPADDVTGLVLLGARFYDPGAGRFLSVDPVLDPQTPSQWNAYAYSYSNPITFSDPSGLRPDETPAGHTWHGSQGFKKSKVSGPASPGTLVKTTTGGSAAGACMGGSWSNYTCDPVPSAGGGSGGSVNCATDVKVGMSSAQVAINAACGRSMAEANIRTKPQWVQDLYGISVGFHDALAPAIPLLAAAAGAAAGSAATRPVSGAASRTVTMGRAMESRVIPYATEHGYGYYKGTPKTVPRSLDKIAPNTLKKVDSWFNKQWIQDQMRQGNRIVDIGESPGMPPSSFYDMERRMTSGYWNYIQDIQP